MVNANHHIFRRLRAISPALRDSVRDARAQGPAADRRRAPLPLPRLEISSKTTCGRSSATAIGRIRSRDHAGTGDRFHSGGQSSRYKDGNWGAMDFTGTWIEGHPRHLFQPPSARLKTDRFHPRQRSLRRTRTTSPYASRHPSKAKPWPGGALFTRYGVTDCKVHLPARLLAGKAAVRIELHVENPQSAQKVADALGTEDHRLRSARTRHQSPADHLHQSRPWRTRSAKPSISLSTTTASSTPTNAGPSPTNSAPGPSAPTPASRSTRAQTTRVPVAATFTINDAVIDPDHPDMDVTVAVNGQALAQWTNWPTRNTHDRVVLLPAHIFRTLDPIHLSIRVKNPRTSYALGWSTWDKRPRGIRLNKLKIAPVLQYHLGEVMDFTAGGPAIAFAAIPSVSNGPCPTRGASGRSAVAPASPCHSIALRRRPRH